MFLSHFTQLVLSFFGLIKRFLTHLKDPFLGSGWKSNQLVSVQNGSKEYGSTSNPDSHEERSGPVSLSRIQLIKISKAYLQLFSSLFDQLFRSLTQHPSHVSLHHLERKTLMEITA
jgi:hypothetical protein